MSTVLIISKRSKKENLDLLRKGGKIPAVYYGKKQASTPVVVSLSDFMKTWKVAGETGVVTLKNGEEELDALIYTIDKDPVTGVFRHADFYVFDKGQKMKVKIPMDFVGVSPAVKDMGGVLVKVLRELEIEASPKNLPRKIDVDISSLIDFKSQILAKDIKLPEGVSLAVLETEVVASVYEPKEEKEEVVAPPDLSAIAVEKKGKEAKEGEEGAPPAGEKKEEGKEAPKK